MPLNGLRWSRNSGSANCDMPQSAVFGRPGGGETSVKYVALNKKRVIPKNNSLYVVPPGIEPRTQGQEFLTTSPLLYQLSYGTIE